MSNSDLSRELLSTLQYGDSFFPTGATSTSNGLEALVDDGVVADAHTLERFIGGQLRWRWHPFERPFLISSHQESQHLQNVASLDQLIHAQSLATEAREGSIRTGRALLRMHVGIKTPGALEYENLVVAKGAHGHNAVVQGLVWSRSGVSTAQSELISAHTFCVTYLGAAIRLGIVGHQNSQSILVQLHESIQELVQVPPAQVDVVTSFCPEQEVAMMRHEKLSSRLFLN